jgi:hypothetical protein
VFSPIVRGNRRRFKYEPATDKVGWQDVIGLSKAYLLVRSAGNPAILNVDFTGEDSPNSS